MIHADRFRPLLLCLAILCVVRVASGCGRESGVASSPNDRAAPPARETSASRQENQPDAPRIIPVRDTESKPPVSTARLTASDGKAPAPVEDTDPDLVRFAFNKTSGFSIYYVIENEFRESGGVPPLLSYSTAIKDRRTLRQRVRPQALRQPVSPDIIDSKISMEWKCSRYEVTESGMRDTLSFDSVRHLYPPPSLWELGDQGGSKVTFTLDPATGQAERFQILPGKVAGDSTRQAMSKLAKKCQLTEANLAGLLHDLGPYWMPDGPVREGQTWTKTYEEDMRTFGRVRTVLECTLRTLRRQGDRRIASVEIIGVVSLVKPTTQPTSGPDGQTGDDEPKATTSPATQPVAAKKATRPQRDFKISRYTCKGSVEFDVTDGVLQSLHLHRETHFAAKIESEKTGPMELQSGSAHILKVKSGRTPPPSPIIVGGKKPPDVPPDPPPALPRSTIPPSRQPPQAPGPSKGAAPKPQADPPATSPAQPAPDDRE